MPFELPVTGQAFLLRPYGLRGYAYWLSSPDFELIVGRNQRFPAALIQVHSAYLHSCGRELALDLVDLLVRQDLFASQSVESVSRIDLYADTQGWQPAMEDLGRFACLASQRRSFQELDAFSTARRFTGFLFGKGSVVARIYDKTLESRRRGSTWPEELWTEADPDAPVWRVEFQFRRQALAEFNLRGRQEVIVALQDLWAYATGTWLSLRVSNGWSRTSLWPEDPEWARLRELRLAPSATGVVRRRIEGASEERVIRGLMGYASSLAALRGRQTLCQVLRDAEPLVSGYLAGRGRSFAAEVAHKAARLLSVTAPVDDLRGSNVGHAGERGCRELLQAGSDVVDVDGTLLCLGCVGGQGCGMRFRLEHEAACGSALRALLRE